MPQRRTIRLLLLGALAATTVALSGCGQFAPLPDEERYQYINGAKDALDLASAGKVVEESYDENVGVFSPSYYDAVIKGDDAYTLLASRVESIVTKPCTQVTEGEVLRCTKNRPSITLINDGESVRLHIYDGLNGRDGE